VELFESNTDYMRWALKTKHYRRGQPLVALMVFRKHLLQEQTYPHDLIRALEGKGLAVLPIFVSGIEAHVALREWVAKEKVDFIVSTMGFAIVGGPAGSTRPGAHAETSAEIMSAINVPYMVAQPLLMQNLEQWTDSGVAPMQSVIMYDLPEMDGSISPIVIGAIENDKIVTVPDRVERVATIAAKWANLRRKAPSERKIALVVYNYPPGLGRLGTAALLNVPATLHALMTRLKQDGYIVGEFPASPDALAKRMATMEGGQGEHVAVPVTDLRAVIKDSILRRIDNKWGSMPGDIAPAGRDAIRLDGMHFDNLFVGVQPPLAVPGPVDDTGKARLADCWSAELRLHLGHCGVSPRLPRRFRVVDAGPRYPHVVLAATHLSGECHLNRPPTLDAIWRARSGHNGRRSLP
jgi:magnesium chelatase subunit H